MSRWRFRSTFPHLRTATAATEFALALPITLLMALAVADFGRVAHFRQIVCNAARTGAETGATHKYTAHTQSEWRAGIQAAVVAEMQNVPDFDVGEMQYDLTTTLDGDELARIDVRVSYPFRTVVDWPLLPSEIQLEKTAHFRQFR
jgi:hypothetical protein